MNENYIPLYRKYRPQTLDSLVGQEHIKRTLSSAIELGKIAHASRLQKAKAQFLMLMSSLSSNST